MTKKYIIGLGCSWTQGEGGYTEQVWKDHGGRVQVRGRSDYYLRTMEHENSWVNVLCRDHFPDYEPINLGVRGIGNRAAVQQLHFCDKVDWDNSTGIIVLMLSGFERLDVLQQHPYSDGTDDFYSDNKFRHYKWRTAWPYPSGPDGDKFWDCYSKELWSEPFVANHQMMTLLELQTFAKAHGYKLVVANAFNQNSLGGVKKYLEEYTRSLLAKFNWDCYLHDTTNYTAMMEKLIDLDGLLPANEWGAYHNFYRKRDWPSKYLTNCEGAHPTLEGYKVIAEELAKFIRLRGYDQKNSKFRKSELSTRP
jgi:hypothetical protein